MDFCAKILKKSYFEVISGFLEKWISVRRDNRNSYVDIYAHMNVCCPKPTSHNQKMFLINVFMYALVIKRVLLSPAQ